MKRTLMLFFLILMFLIISLPAVAAETKDKNTATLSASEALDQLEADMNRPTEISILASNPTQVNIGTNKTFTWANHGASISPVPGGCAVGWGYANEPGWAALTASCDYNIF
ncbi:hypothetical protein Psch_01286 [Pelotomaculum schinkii]|uniref:Uncharacterized protein n=1 Tax=Pelotomaculum schinkii TaxID=78350 RepID=A0A4Y7RG27_9FIRM|nr:hypothetical protein [Pelotomaculum schinkii]TEB07731.1 hypothetical protein Psch_01286 [Pelotomaculum schinkii]